MGRSLIPPMEHCEIHANVARAQPLGGRRVQGYIFIDPPTSGSFLHGGSVWLYYIAIKWIISRFTFQLYTRLNDLKFQIPQKNQGRGSPSPPDPPPLLLGLRPRFKLHPQISGASPSEIRASPDLDPNFWSVVALLEYRELIGVVGKGDESEIRYAQWRI